MSESVSQTIEEVHLAQCDAITDESIECILTRSKRIKYLLFHGCPKTTGTSTFFSYPNSFFITLDFENLKTLKMFKAMIINGNLSCMLISLSFCEFKMRLVSPWRTTCRTQATSRWSIWRGQFTEFKHVKNIPY